VTHANFLTRQCPFGWPQPSLTPIFKMTARPLSHILRARCLLRQPQNTQAFSTRSSLRAADHGDHYDPPTGWLFGVKPGQKYVKEGWENIWYYGFIGSFLVAGVAYVFKPDTSYVQSLSRSVASILASYVPRTTGILTIAIVYKLGLLKKPDGDWKLRASSRTLTRSRNKRQICTLYIEIKEGLFRFMPVLPATADMMFRSRS
jgi:hypothetical protein